MTRIGRVKIDLYTPDKRIDDQYDYSPRGIVKALRSYAKLKVYAEDTGNYSIVELLCDVDRGLEDANLTLFEHDVCALIKQGYNLYETAKKLDRSKRQVLRSLTNAVEKISLYLEDDINE